MNEVRIFQQKIPALNRSCFKFISCHAEERCLENVHMYKAEHLTLSLEVNVEKILEY